MKAIAKGQVDGFPPADQVRTAYVAHDLDASVSEATVTDFLVKDPLLVSILAKEENIIDVDKRRQRVTEVLTELRFSPALQEMQVGNLSGGWKMKLALGRAVLMRADILLLDEPTNHLDAANVKWLEDYLISKKEVTSIIVSHDSGFLENVCTDIVHYHGKKLRNYHGSLSHFVSVRPEAKAYYTLESTTKYKFPHTGYLEGVNSQKHRILSMKDVTFTYPGTGRQVLNGVSIRCDLSSRVAVVGANGAGKSTMIKILVGELQPSEGSMYKHPNLRLAYVA